MTAALAKDPTPLAARVGRLDAAALERAQAALESLAVEFAGWMADELARLEQARDRLLAAPTHAAADEIFARAHDLKGLGSTYGHPLATRLCASLCRLLDDPAHRATAPAALVDAHVAAVRADVDGLAEAQTLAACLALEVRVEVELARRAPRTDTGR